MTYTTKIRTSVSRLLEYGKDYTVTHYDKTTEDVWGKTDTTGVDSTETLFIVRKYTGDKFSREGVKTVEYIVALASYNSVIEVGDKIQISGDDYWVEGIQLAELEEGSSLFKRVRAIKEEYE